MDPDARHGHKTSARRFDGFNGHAAIDPDSAHMLRAGRRARRRGQAKVDADWNPIGAAINYARLACLGLANIAVSS